LRSGAQKLPRDARDNRNRLTISIRNESPCLQPTWDANEGACDTRTIALTLCRNGEKTTTCTIEPKAKDTLVAVNRYQRVARIGTRNAAVGSDPAGVGRAEDKTVTRHDTYARTLRQYQASRPGGFRSHFRISSSRLDFSQCAYERCNRSVLWYACIHD
jgi:hypothetical protein